MNIKIEIPEWLQIDTEQIFTNEKEKMKLAIEFAKKSIDRGGGPFGAVIFLDNKAIAAGANLVVKEKLSILHAEIVAIMLAQKKFKTYDLSKIGLFELYSSSEPCAMCLGAILWSGIKSVVFGAKREDAMAVGFDEGPVFEQSWEYLKNKGIKVKGGVLRNQVKDILLLYKKTGGVIYSP